jgi:hypothetical protein
MILSGKCSATLLTNSTIAPDGEPSRSSIALHFSHVHGPSLSIWLTDQYLNYIHSMNVPPDEISAFLVVAAK